MNVLTDWYLLCNLWYKLIWLCFMWRCSCFGDKALCHKGWLRQQAAHTAGPPKREQSPESALVPEKGRSNDKDWVVSKRLTGWFCNSNISPLIHESCTKQMHRSDSGGMRLMIRKSNTRKMVRQILALQTVSSGLKRPECRMISPCSVSPSQNSAEQRGIKALRRSKSSLDLGDSDLIQKKNQLTIKDLYRLLYILRLRRGERGGPEQSRICQWGGRRVRASSSLSCWCPSAPGAGSSGVRRVAPRWSPGSPPSSSPLSGCWGAALYQFIGKERRTGYSFYL